MCTDPRCQALPPGKPVPVWHSMPSKALVRGLSTSRLVVRCTALSSDAQCLKVAYSNRSGGT